jgi:hypothetical protein
MPVQGRRHFLGCPPMLEQSTSKVNNTVRCARVGRHARTEAEQVRARRPQVQLYSFPTLFFHHFVFIALPLDHWYKTTAIKSNPSLPSLVTPLTPCFSPLFWMTFLYLAAPSSVTPHRVHRSQVIRVSRH